MHNTGTLSLRVTQASLNQTALDWPQNMANIYAAIDEAVRQKSDMVLMPELSLTGYEVNDDFRRTDNVRIYEALRDIAAYANTQDPDLMVSVGHPWRVNFREEFDKAAANPDFVKNVFYDRLSRPFNVQTLICGGELLGMTAKANLFNDERGYEGRYFNEWSFRDAEQTAHILGKKAAYGTFDIAMPDGKEIPFGRPLTFVTDENGNHYVHAVAICEEKWVASQYDGAPHDDERYQKRNIIPSIARYLGSKTGILLEIADASPPAKLKNDKHEHLNALASKEADIVIDTDGLGTSGATFAQFGHRMISQFGKTISTGVRMTFGQIATTTSTIKILSADPYRAGKTHAELKRAFKSPSAESALSLAWETDKAAAWDDPANENRWIEERLRNQALWMFDYMRKTRSIGIAEALSGGKDSAYNCVMVRVMVELAMRDLGVEGFCKQMTHLPYKDDILSAYKDSGYEAAVEACMNEMLTAVYMGTNNSSFETFDASETLLNGGALDDGATYKGIGGKFFSRNIQDLVTSCAFIFGTENSSQIPFERKAEILAELEKFVHASPYEHTPKEMQDWADRVRKDYPEISELTSAALPGQGVAYENFQARIREVLIMAVANVEAKMAVANPNLDEAYGAYATFGGDLHSGTVNWNAGLHKADQEAIMNYLENHGVEGVMGPLVALAKANNNRPTAELQPKKDGAVVQHDEEAMQGTFPQKKALADLMHHTLVWEKDGGRLMNAGEIFVAAKAHAAFEGLDESEIFNRVVVFYHRWQIAQHKIHATPIAPTFGSNVDKQTSLRTPNLSGGSADEITALGIDLLFDWALQDDLDWTEGMREMLHKRAWQDQGFVQQFRREIANAHFGEEGHVLQYSSFDLRGLYARLKSKGWDAVFTPLDAAHPLQGIATSRQP